MPKPSKTLSRREIRYWLFRFRTQALGGDKATKAPSGLRKHYESQDEFSDWESFSTVWDVAQDDPDTIRLKDTD